MKEQSIYIRSALILNMQKLKGQGGTFAPILSVIVFIVMIPLGIWLVWAFLGAVPQDFTYENETLVANNTNVTTANEGEVTLIAVANPPILLGGTGNDAIVVLNHSGGVMTEGVEYTANDSSGIYVYANATYNETANGREIAASVRVTYTTNYFEGVDLQSSIDSSESNSSTGFTLAAVLVLAFILVVITITVAGIGLRRGA